MPVSIEERKNRDGTVTYRVRWREADTRPTYTFNTGRLGDQADAMAGRFAALVEAAGDRLPDRAALAIFGLDWIHDGDEPSTDASTANRLTGPVTVADMCRRYLDHLAHSLDPPTARTLDDYARYLRLYVDPRPLGKRDCADPEITFLDVDQWQRELASTIAPGGRKPLGSNSIAKIRAGVLAPAFDWACSPKSAVDATLAPLRTAANPVTHSTAPGLVEAPARDILRTPDDYELFTRCAYGVDRNWADWVVTVAGTGLRDGEAVMMAGAAVDPRRGVLTVVERFTGGRVEAGGKNGTRRDVPVPDAIMARIIAPRLAAGGRLLFTGPAGARWSYATAADRWVKLRARLADAGLPIHLTPHGLRTSFNTWLTSEDIHPTKIDLVMGHRPPTLRRIYTQLTDRDHQRIRAALAPLFAAGWPA